MTKSPFLSVFISIILTSTVSGSTAFAQNGPTYLNPYDITLGETLPEKYSAVDCKQINTEGTQDLEQCLVTPDLSRKVDTMKIVRLKSADKIYIVQAIKNAASEDKARRFAGNEYARMLMSYKPKITEGGIVRNQEYEGWGASEESNGGTLVDERRSVIMDVKIEADRSIISYALHIPESAVSIKELIAHIPKQ